MECPELTLLRVYALCEGDGAKLTHMTELYGRYAKSDEAAIPMRDLKHAQQAMEHLAGKYQGCATSRLDGLTVDCWDGGPLVAPEDGFWFNIRPSNTEPVMRLVVESKRKDLLDARVREVSELVA